MSLTDREHAADFLSRFALPLVQGGAVQVQAPLGPAGHQRLLRAAASGQLDDTEAGQALRAARREALAPLCLDPPRPRLRDDLPALGLLSAWHDLLFLLHPAADRLLLHDRRLRRVVQAAQALCEPAALAPPSPLEQPDADAGRRYRRLCLTRHSLLHNLWALGRTDVRVSFWAGRQEFLGQEPPPRLLLWRDLRRVQIERSRVTCYLQLLGSSHESIGQRQAFSALLSASPLTDLLTPRRLGPPLSLSRHAALFRDAGLLRLLTHHYLELGLFEIARALGTALCALLGEAADPGDLRTVLRFASHLHLCVLLGIPGEEPPEPVRPGAESSVRDFYGLYAALCASWPPLAFPADAPADLLERARRYAAACRRLCGAARFDELIGLLSRALGAQREPPATPPQPEPIQKPESQHERTAP